MKKLMLLILATCLAQPLTSKNQPLGSKNQHVVFAFDIHGVLMNLAIGEVVATSFKELWAQPGLILKMGDFFDGKAAENPAMRRMFNCQVPVCKTWEIVNQIKAHQYPQVIFSNIGTPTYHELTKKYPKLFDTFTDSHTVPSDNIKLRKPNPQAFESLKKMVHARYPTTTKIIFIDDSKKNIKAARRAELTGILFSSPEQLKLDIEKELGHPLIY